MQPAHGYSPATTVTEPISSATIVACVEVDGLVADKVKQSWETLQDALDELGQQGWDLCTTIYGPTRERGGPGEHYCEGFILKRTG